MAPRTMSVMSSPVEFLELLAREAAAVEFAGPLVAARAAGLRVVPVPADRNE